MNRQTLCYSFAALLAAPPCSSAASETAAKLEKMVVTAATRSETELREIGSTVTVITAADIESRQAVSVVDVLHGVPGLDVVQAGGPGRTVSVFLRGAESGQTLVLIDGIEMNDPGSTSNSFDFADLMTDNIERIEILKGPQSTLYGSDAIGGVINIITKKGRGTPRYQLQAQGGRYDTFKVGGGVSGGTERFDYSVSASRFETGGFSAADRRDGNRERDGYKNTTVAARFGLRPAEIFDLDFSLRFQDGEAQFDDCGGPGCDDPDRHGNTEELYTRLQGGLDLFDGFWKQTLGIAYTNSDRRFVDVPDAVSPFGNLGASTSTFQGEKIKVNWQHILELHETNTLTLGAENEEEWMSTNEIGRKSANTTGLYLQDQIRLLDRFFTTAGVRYDEHNRVGGRVTWRVTQSINIDEIGTRLKGSYGTGFKAPSLYQQFAPPGSFGPIGNPDLRPEKSRGWDAGFEQSLWDERVLLGATYFHNTFIDLIDFTFGDGYQNVDRALSEGVESFVEFTPLDDLILRGSYTYTRTKDDDTGERLVRRPAHKGSFNANYRFLEGADVNLNVMLVGTRDFQNFSTGSRETLPGYVRVDLAAGYQVNKYLKVFARVDNLFDKKYQEILGFGTSRIAGYGGVRVSFE